MPEGDTVYVHAQWLREGLVGRSLSGAFSRWPAVVRGVVGCTVESVEPIGKHLLIGLDDATTLRVHLGMKGRWHQTAVGTALRVSRGNLSLQLDTDASTVSCVRAPTVDRFRTRERPVHPALRRLGPDVLGPGFSAAEAAERAISLDTTSEYVGEVLLDQHVACGIGNVYKSELLFLERIHPFTPVSAMRLEQWQALYERASRLMRLNLAGGPRDTARLGPGRPRHWVYGRQRRGCLRCRTRIEARMQGRDLPRITTWCPRCQPEAA